MKEVWKDVVDYEGFYQVSNLGKIKRLNHSDSYGRTYKERILKTESADKRGYCRVHLSKNGITKWHLVHRIVAIAFCEKKDGNDIVNHIDNDPSNNVAPNLEWTTYKGNMQHSTKQGRMRHHPENLKKAQESRKTAVTAIAKNGDMLEFDSQVQAAQELGISSKHIAACCRKEYGYNRIGEYEFVYTDVELQSKQKPKKIKMTEGERKEFYSERMLGNTLMLGRKLDEQTKEKLRRSTLCKPVKQFDKNGNLIREYISTQEARRLTGINHIASCCNGKRKTAGGYTWQYK